ncbi:MAG: serine/threonine protein kinase [Planctomycetales bacterium]|nr:serine/threonine protein kinase [Planctomycetales bacterium]
MNAQQKHASDIELQHLVFSDDASDEYRAASLHVESCPHCQTRLADLAASSEFVGDAHSLLNSYPSLARASATTSGENRFDFLSPPSHPEMLGRLERYEIERVIGTGGMGVVFKAFDTELNRPVAIKVLARHLAHSGAARQRFAREAKAAAAIVHEHVVAIHNVDSGSEIPFLVMQFVGGESLQSRVERTGPLDAKEILRIGIQSAAGLTAAHQQGVIHRDIKPANILLEDGVERVLLTDFGLARTVDDASLTQTGVVAGTPHYMSPEQANGQATDHRTDLFSLGGVLYFMATGHPPFRAERAMGVLNRICHDRQKSLWEIAEHIPDELSVLVDRLLEKNPARRPASAEAVQAELTELLALLQQPRSGATSRLRRLWLRYPGRLLATGASITLAVVCGVVAISKLTPLHHSGSDTAPEAVPQSTSKFTSDVPPVFNDSESTEFARTMSEVRRRLDELSNPDAFDTSPNFRDTSNDSLQSIHQRLDRLQLPNSESFTSSLGEQ